MFETGKKSHSLFQLPSIQPHHSLEAARFLQKYLHRMRTVEMPDYSKIKSFVAKDSLTKLYHKSKSIKKPLKPEKELVIDSIDKYLELLSPFLLDKTSQHHRRLLHRVEEMIRNYPLMSEYLFESPESKKLVISPETLYSRLHDEHNPPLIHIIEKIEEFAKEEQDDELFSLGIRIKTLNRSLREALDRPLPDSQTKQILKIHFPSRLNESISRNLATSQVKYGQFSKGLRKKEEMLIKLNKVVEMISSE